MPRKKSGTQPKKTRRRPHTQIDLYLVCMNPDHQVWSVEQLNSLDDDSFKGVITLDQLIDGLLANDGEKLIALLQSAAYMILPRDKKYRIFLQTSQSDLGNLSIFFISKDEKAPSELRIGEQHFFHGHVPDRTLAGTEKDVYLCGGKNEMRDGYKEKARVVGKGFVWIFFHESDGRTLH